MRILAALFITVILFASPSFLFADKTYSQLPSFVMNGKTVFIENATGDATLQHAVYLEVARWGRLDVVASREKADIVIAISGPNMVRTMATSESSGGYPASSAAAESGDTVPAGYTRI